MTKLRTSAGLIAVAVLLMGCSAGRLVPRASTASSPAAPTLPAFRTLKMLHATQADGGIFTGQIVRDGPRHLLLAGEQTERGATLAFRTRVIDEATWRTLRHIPGLLRGEDPVHGLVYTEASAADTLEVYPIGGGKPIARLPIDDGGLEPALDQDGSRTYVIRRADIDVYSVPGFRIVSRLPIQNSDRISFEAARRVLYVSTEGSLIAVDPNDGHTIRTIAGGTRAGWPVPGSSSFLYADGTYKGSDLALRNGNGGLAWSIHVARGLTQPVADPSRSLVFDALNDLTYSEFAPKPDPPDVVEARSWIDGRVLGRISVPDGPETLLADPENRRMLVTTIESYIVVLAY